MARICCLAGIDHVMVPKFSAVLKAAGAPALATLARLDVTELGRLAPDLLVCDIDELDVDPLELLRRIRFVLPDCLIAVYTGVMKRTWCVACHLAGANGLLSKGSDDRALSKGVRGTLRSGCYTDPAFRGRIIAKGFRRPRRRVDGILVPRPATKRSTQA